MSTKLKPFNLEAALRGEPVVTRDGRPVTQVTKFDAPNDPNPVIAVIDGETQSFTLAGTYFGQSKETEYDLFMATKTVKKEGWVVLWKTDIGKVYVTGVYTKSELLSIPNLSWEKITELKVEWEEEI